MQTDDSNTIMSTFWTIPSLLIVAIVSALYAVQLYYDGHDNVQQPELTKFKMDLQKALLRGSDGHVSSDNNNIDTIHNESKDDVNIKLPLAPLTNLSHQTRNVSTRISVITKDATPQEKMLKYFSNETCRYSKDTQPEPWLKQMFILIGVQKGGTKAIHTFLEEHPHFVTRCSNQSSTKELFFFNSISIHNNEEIPQAEYQERYANLIKTMCPLAVGSLQKDRRKLYLDDTPLYMQDSHMVPRLTNCITPWAKVMAILRDPVERAFSHFNFYLERNWCAEKSFDEWVDLNIQRLKETGVLDAKDPYQELLAWQHYNEVSEGHRRCETFVTRGLYAIQLLHFVNGLKAAGRPASDLLVIHSNDMKGEKRQATYDKVLEFLSLEPHTLKHDPNVHKTTYEKTMKDSTKAKLEKFYRPYNRRLYNMLGWDAVWD
jgi:hypothetical protein